MALAASKVTTIGSYPRPPFEGGEFRLRKSLQALDRREANADDVRAAEDELTAEIIEEQVAAGVDLVTDGQVRWDDPVTRIAEGLDGFSISGLLRYFDNNTYFRQPVVKAPVTWRGPVLVEELRYAIGVSPVPVKAVLCGPYTLGTLSRDEHYGEIRALVRDLAVAVNMEARALAQAGAPVIQFDEPALADIPGQRSADLEVIAEVAATVVEGVDATTLLATYFGDVAHLGPGVLDLPFDGFGLDFVSGPANFELVHEYPAEKVLQAGIVDARNTRLETPQRLESVIGELSECVDPERLWIAPSCGLEYLPREAARAKLRLLGDAKGGRA